MVPICVGHDLMPLAEVTEPLQLEDSINMSSSDGSIVEKTPQTP
jgi:hypothetical protein